MQCRYHPLTVLTLFRSKDRLSPRPALHPAMTIYNVGWVFATRLEEGLSPTPTLWWPDSFYFTFLYHCQNAYPLIRFLAFITGGHQMDLNSFRNNQFAFGLCSKMPSHYSFSLPSMHSIIFPVFSEDHTSDFWKPWIDLIQLSRLELEQGIFYCQSMTCSCISTYNRVTKCVTVRTQNVSSFADSTPTPTPGIVPRLNFPFALFLRPRLWVMLPSKYSF